MTLPGGDPIPESHIREFRSGPPPGFTRLLSLDEPGGVGIDFSILRLEAHQDHEVPSCPQQTAVVLLSGRGEVAAGATRIAMRRQDVFRDLPHAALVPGQTPIHAHAGNEGMELALARVAGLGGHAPLELPPAAVRVEERGKGQLGGSFHRQVRTVAEGSSAPGWGMVFGEVVSRPGAWSSYPPHHHPQPEIYYYRFDQPRGYGHAEVGERVYKVRSHDITVMRAGEDHSQASAPGYRMWYLWVIRNLPDLPYDVPEFSEEHRWLLTARRLPRTPPRNGER